MTKTNSYQRAKLRVAELEKELDSSNIKVRQLSLLYKQKSDDSENAFKQAAEVLAENANLKEELNKSIKTTKIFIILSLQLVAIIIVLIATK